MIHQVLLRRAVQDRDPVLRDFVDALAPAILTHLAAIPALGGSGRPCALADPSLPEGLEPIPQEARAYFAERHDQSMVTHILNGVFAGMRIAEKLPRTKALSDVEKRLWLLAFVAHDYTKVYGVRVQASDLDTIRRLITCLGEKLGFVAFMPDWKDYLDDIVFLAQNTQTVEGANLSLRDYAAKTHPRRLEVLRLLSSYADVLVHVTSPADVAVRGTDGRDRASNLREKLDILFGAGQAPRLAYHRLTEVRGLISNLINNVTMEALEDQGCEPYLFFPNGVVYLVAPDRRVRVDRAVLADRVWTRAVDIVTQSEDFGVRRAGTGLIPSSALFELMGLLGVLQVGRRKAMSISTSHATQRLYGYFTGESVSDVLKRVGDPEQAERVQADLVRERGLPDDVRVDRLAEFLTFVCRAVNMAYRKAPNPVQFVLDELQLSPEVTVEDATRQKGGTYFGWYYAAARYVQGHAGIDDAEMDDLMAKLSDSVSRWIERSGGVGRCSDSIGKAIRQYVSDHVEVSDACLDASVQASFSEELSRYLKNKERRQPQCSLCSAPFDTVLQEMTEVPFVNQQYSNKSPLAGPTVIRGVCPICRVEMILRKVQQPRLSDGDRPIHIYLYPTYFFTLETARVIKTFLSDMEDLNLSTLIAHMYKSRFDPTSLVQYEGFWSETGHSHGIMRQRFSEHEPAALLSFALRPLSRKPTDTDAWILPTVYGLALPLLLNVKVVVTPSFVPLFASGSEFRETTVLDAPHGFTRYVLARDRFRLDQVGECLARLLCLYDLHLDVFAEPTDLHWAQLNSVAKDVATDPLFVFAYYDRKQRGDRKRRDKSMKGGVTPTGIPHWDLDRYIRIYEALGGERDMGFIGKIVDAYARFYQAEFGKLNAAHAVLRPLMTAIDVTIESDPLTTPEDLALLVAGAINDDQERVRSGQADGFDPIITNKELGPYPERLALSRQRIDEFARLFLEEVFTGYCQGDRAVLRERANRIRSAARFYYLTTYGRK